MPITSKKFEFWLNNFLLGLALLILLLVLIGDHSSPYVIATNLPEKVNPAEQRYIKVDFNRLMDRKSVEEAFTIEPVVAGKFSWSGKSMVYSLDESLSYGQTYFLKIASSARSQDGKPLAADFEKTLAISDLKIAYVAKTGVNEGKIVLADGQGKIVRTFSDGQYNIEELVFSPDQQRIYFLGAKGEANSELHLIDLNNGQLRQITNDSRYVNKNFILSDDGKAIAMGRVKVSAGGDYESRIEVWLAHTDDFQFQKFKDGQAQGVDIAFSPGGVYLLYRNADANFELSKVFLKPGEQDEALFIGEYSANFGFHPFLPKIAFTQYDQQDVFSLNNSLILFSGDGDKKTLDFPKGVVRDFVFSQNGKFAVVLFSGEEDNLTVGDSLSESRIFHLYKYDLASGEISKLTDDGNYSESNPELSPDSRYLIFERVLATEENLIDPAFREVQEEIGGVSPEVELWIMDLKSGQLRNLNINGEQVKFLP